MDPIFSHQEPRDDLTAPADGPLAGLEVALQPNISVRGWPTEAGSHALAGFTALEDATVVARLREAGALLRGSTRMSEFGLGLPGSQAGGALREGAADVELMLDFMGEARLAAARAAVCALKPSYGLVSRLGLVGLIPSMEACAVLAASPESIRAVLAAIAGPDERDLSLPDEEAPDLAPHPLRVEEITVGVIAEAQEGLVAGEAEKFRASLSALENRGITLREVSLPDYPLFALVHRIAGSVEASSSAGRYDSVRYGPRVPGAKNWNEMYLLSRGAAFGTLLKSYLIQGAVFQFERYEAFEDACRIRRQLVEQMERLTDSVDFLALPLSNGAAPNVSDASSAASPGGLSALYADLAQTLFANVTGQPVLYVPPLGGTWPPPPATSPPLGGTVPPPPGTEPQPLSTAPLPSRNAQAGLQLTGPRLSDGRLLALGKALLDTAGKGGD